MSFGVDEFGRSLFEDNTPTEDILEAKQAQDTRTDTPVLNDTSNLIARCTRCGFYRQGSHTEIDTVTKYHEDTNEGHVIGWTDLNATNTNG